MFKYELICIAPLVSTCFFDDVISRCLKSPRSKAVCRDRKFHICWILNSDGATKVHLLQNNSVIVPCFTCMYTSTFLLVCLIITCFKYNWYMVPKNEQPCDIFLTILVMFSNAFFIPITQIHGHMVWFPTMCHRAIFHVYIYQIVVRYHSCSWKNWPPMSWGMGNEARISNVGRMGADWPSAVSWENLLEVQDGSDCMIYTYILVT